MGLPVRKRANWDDDYSDLHPEMAADLRQARQEMARSAAPRPTLTARFRAGLRRLFRR